MVRDTKLYDRLEIEPTADDAQIKKAYNKLSKIYHPDKIFDDKKEEYTLKFKEITEAKEILLDETKRRNYDQFGLDMPEPPQQPNINPFDIFANMGMFNNFSHSFNFSHNFSHPPKQNIMPEHIVALLNVTLEQIYNEDTITFNYKYNLSCSTCGFKEIKCNECNGTGRREQIITMPNMIQTISSPCGVCSGRGEINNNTNCNDCNSQTFIVKDKILSVPLKAGLVTGNKIEIEGKGHHIRNNKSNLILEINILPHSIFKRHNDNLFIIVELKLYQALFGFDKEITHLDGRKLYISYKNKITHNTFKKIQGEGMKLINSDKKGDLYIKFNIVLPEINEEDKEKAHKMLRLLDKNEVINEINLLKNPSLNKVNLHDCKNTDEFLNII